MHGFAQVYSPPEKHSEDGANNACHCKLVLLSFLPFFISLKDWYVVVTVCTLLVCYWNTVLCHTDTWMKLSLSQFYVLQEICIDIFVSFFMFRKCVIKYVIWCSYLWKRHQEIEAWLLNCRWSSIINLQTNQVLWAEFYLPFSVKEKLIISVSSFHSIFFFKSCWDWRQMQMLWRIWIN